MLKDMLTTVLCFMVVFCLNVLEDFKTGNRMTIPEINSVLRWLDGQIQGLGHRITHPLWITRK